MRSSHSHPAASCCPCRGCALAIKPARSVGPRSHDPRRGGCGRSGGRGDRGAAGVEPWCCRRVPVRGMGGRWQVHQAPPDRGPHHRDPGLHPRRPHVPGEPPPHTIPHLRMVPSPSIPGPFPRRRPRYPRDPPVPGNSVPPPRPLPIFIPSFLLQTRPHTLASLPPLPICFRPLHLTTPSRPPPPPQSSAFDLAAYACLNPPPPPTAAAAAQDYGNDVASARVSCVGSSPPCPRCESCD